MKIIKGRGGKEKWLFLVDENNNIVRGFRGGISAVTGFLRKKYAGYALGEIHGKGAFRYRDVVVKPFVQVRQKERCEHAYAKGFCPFCDGYEHKRG